MMRCGIFGGSFNPIHDGHTRLAQMLTQRGWVDEVWLMVSPLNPLKQGDTELLDDKARLRLAQLATEGLVGVKASDFEMHLSVPSYMVRTLEELRRAYADKEFLLVVGADNWLRFNQWKDADEILRHHCLLVYPRRGFEVDKGTLPENVTLVDTPLIDLSATDIRRAIAEGLYKGEGMNPQVWEEIKKKGYYR